MRYIGRVKNSKLILTIGSTKQNFVVSITITAILTSAASNVSFSVSSNTQL